MPKRKETPFDKIVMTRGKLGLYVRHGDVALDGQDPQEFADEVQECFQHLLDFRNMVNEMAALEQAPMDVVKSYSEEE